MENELKIVLDADMQNAITNVKKFGTSISVLENQLIRLQKIASSTTLGFKDQEKVAALLNKTQGELNKFKRAAETLPPSLSSVTKSSNTATFALTNLGRVAQDLPFGFVGIANNITPLIESFRSLSVNAKASGSTLGKELLSSLKGGGGLILGFSLLSSALSLASVGFSAFTRGMGGAKKEADDTEDEFKSLANSIAGSLTNFTLLAGVVQNVNSSYQDKRKALAEINKEYKKYLDAVGIEKVTIENLDVAYNKLIDTLLRQAVVKGIQNQVAAQVEKIAEQIVKINIPIAKTQVESEKAANSLLNMSKGLKDSASTQPQLTKLSSVFDQIGIATSDGAIAAGQYKDAISKNIAQANSFSNVQARVAAETERLKKELKESLAPLLFLADGFKDLGLEDPLKKQTDNILEKARQFVKEFGDVFVVPDLTETFFKGEKELLPEAQKLLDDVAKGNLKIKIPVQTDFELLPESEGVSQSTIDNFFKSVQLEANIPVDVNIDPTLSKDSTDKILQKLDLRKQFDNLGGLKIFQGIDFSDISTGIDEAKSKLNDLKSLAETVRSSIVGTFQSFGEEIGNALGGKGDLFKSVFDIIGSGVQQLGKQIIALGVAALKVRAALASLIANPGLAIVAGVALTAIGTAMKNVRGVKGFASGGFVSGPGTGKSDSIPAMLSNGEFVVNEKSTRENIRLLRLINSGFKFPGFASGGLVGVSKSFAGIGSRSFNNVIGVAVTGEIRNDVIRISNSRGTNSGGLFG